MEDIEFVLIQCILLMLQVGNVSGVAGLNTVFLC